MGRIIAFSRAALATVALSTIGAGAAHAQPLVDAPWLARHLDDADLVVVDVRMDEEGEAAHRERHVPGAVFTHYLRDGWLATRDGVRAVLPEAAKLEALIGNLGIDESVHAVLVSADTSATGYAALSRVYWTLKVAGHERVSILDGGLRAWIEHGQPLASGLEPAEPALFEVRPSADPHAGIDAVAAAVDGRRAAQLLDLREAGEYRGDRRHPWVTRGGALPGAIHLPAQALVDAASGRLAARAQLAETLERAGVGDGAVIAYCNTGHLAALGWFVASELLGRRDVALYDGSLVEWASDPTRRLSAGWAEARLGAPTP